MRMGGVNFCRSEDPPVPPPEMRGEKANLAWMICVGRVQRTGEGCRSYWQNSEAQHVRVSEDHMQPGNRKVKGVMLPGKPVRW